MYAFSATDRTSRMSNTDRRSTRLLATGFVALMIGSAIAVGVVVGAPSEDGRAAPPTDDALRDSTAGQDVAPDAPSDLDPTNAGGADVDPTVEPPAASDFERFDGDLWRSPTRRVGDGGALAQQEGIENASAAETVRLANLMWTAKRRNPKPRYLGGSKTSR